MRRKPYIINIIVSAVLIVVGLLAYFASGAVNLTPLMPAMIGVGLLLFSPFMQRDRFVRYMVAVLTFLLFGAGLFLSIQAVERGTPYDSVSIASWVSFTAMAVMGLFGVIMYALTFSYSRRFTDAVRDAQRDSRKRYGEA